MKLFSLLFLLFFAIGLPLSSAQVTEENQIMDVLVKSPIGEAMSYTLLRDYKNKNQWYYEPRRLRLVEKKTPGGKVMPDFYIIKYQYYDKKARNGIGQGGLLQLLFTFSAYPEEEEQLNIYIKKQTNNPNAKVACMRYKTSNYIIAPMGNNNFLAENYEYKPLPGTVSAGNMAVSIPLTDVGASVLQKAGIVIDNVLVYEAYKAPCGGTIKGTWNNIYSYAEKLKTMGGGLSIAGIKLGGTYSKKEIKEDFKKNMNLDIIEYDCGKDDNTSPFLDGVVKMIQDEVFTKNEIGLATEIQALKDLLAKNDPNLSQSVIDKIKSAIQTTETSFRASYANKTIKQTKTGTISYSMNKYTLVSKSNVISGVLSLAQYNLSEEDVKKHITEVSVDGEYPYACFSLPHLFDESERIIGASITIRPPVGNSLNASFTNKSGWINTDGEPITSLSFPLLGISKEDLRKQVFKADVSIQSLFSNNSIFLKDVPIEALGQSNNLDVIRQLFQKIIVTPGTSSELSFYSLTGNVSDLEFVKVAFKNSKENSVISKDLRPEEVDGKIYPPSSLVCLSPIKYTVVEIGFRQKGVRELIPWYKNGELSDPSITITDTDWR